MIRDYANSATCTMQPGQCTSGSTCEACRYNHRVRRMQTSYENANAKAPRRVDETISIQRFDHDNSLC